jgi:hypothetical protein
MSEITLPSKVKIENGLNAFTTKKIGHISRVCRKQLWDENHRQEHSSNV